MKTTTDPVFGALVWKGEWSGRVRVPLLERDFEIYIFSAGLEPDLGAFWTLFLERQTQLKNGVERALFTYLQTHLEEITEPWLEADEPFPFVVNEPADMWTLVRPLDSVWLNRLRDGAPIIDIQCDADWDEEHGLELSFSGDLIGVASGGMHWLDHDHYTLEGNPVIPDV